MIKSALAIFLLLLFFFSCSLFLNDETKIVVSYNGVPIQYSLDLNEEKELSISFKATDPDSSIQSVYLNVDADMVDITAYDTNSDPDIFESSYIFPPLNSGGIREVSLTVKDNNNGITVKNFQLDTSAAIPADPDNPVEVIIPEIYSADSGLLANPTPKGDVYYYNDLNEKEESDIQLDNPIFGTMHVNRYLKVSGLAIPNDSGYTDRGYHSVLFTVEGNNNSSYYTIPVNSSNRFRGYLYFPDAGTYTVMAYRAWNSYLYPHRSTSHSVREGYSTLKFTVKIAEGNQVPAGYHHLLPTRNVDNGSKYLREYAEMITSGVSTDMEKAKAVFRFLSEGDENGDFNYRYYDQIYPGYLDNCWSDIFIASHFLINRKGVCNDFSELYAALTRALGFKVQKIWGYVPGSTGHQWNRIEIDGTWYRLDSTWACGSSNWKQYAEFYTEFDSNYFRVSHENKYYSGLTTEY